MGEPVEVPSLPEGGNIDIKQLAGLFASKVSQADLEKRLAECEKTNKTQD